MSAKVETVCVACNKRSEFFGKDEFVVWKKPLWKGWRPLYLDAFTCPMCSVRIEDGEMPTPAAPAKEA